MSEPSTDLVVLPWSGELISPTDPEECARVLDEIKDVESRLKELKGMLKNSLLEHSAQQGAKTFHFPGRDVTISTVSVTVWDHEALLELRDPDMEGTPGISEDRYNELVTMEISYKVDGRVARSIASSNPRYATIIEGAKTVVPREPTVTVKTTKT